MNEFVSNDENVDPTLLKVLGNKGSKDGERDSAAYVKTLANAVLKVVSKHGVAKLRCVGAAAVNNAMKSVIVASVEADQKGIKLVVVSRFDVVIFDGIEKTALLFEVVER